MIFEYKVRARHRLGWKEFKLYADTDIEEFLNRNSIGYVRNATDTVENRIFKENKRLNKLIEKYDKELKHKTEQYEFLRHYHNLKDMKQYPIERDVFCNIFRKIDKEFYDELYDVTTEHFKCWWYDDEFYILHLNSGTLINWYKHLGRCNTCNKDLSISEYESIAKLLYNELKGSDKE